MQSPVPTCGAQSQRAEPSPDLPSPNITTKPQVPTAAELSTPPRERLVGRRDAIHGLVMGAGDRSYLIRDGEINVMRNVLGGMEDAGVESGGGRGLGGDPCTLSPLQLPGVWVPSTLKAMSFALACSPFLPHSTAPAVKLSFGMPESGGTPGTGRRSTRRSSLGPAAASGGGSLTPSRALLMAAESKMAMLTPLRKSNLIHADIETGRVVSEWSFQKDGVDIPMDDIVGDTKASQVRGEGRDPGGSVLGVRAGGWQGVPGKWHMACGRAGWHSGLPTSAGKSDPCTPNAMCS